MDLDRKVSLVPASAGKSLDGQASMTLFDAVRKWTDDEGAGNYAIVSDGTQMTREQIQEVAHSQAFVDRLQAFDERR
jgi:hypothetical protein